MIGAWALVCLVAGVESPGRARRVRLAGPCSSLVLGLPATGSPDGGVLPARGTGSKGLRTGVSRGLGAACVPRSAAPWVGERSGAGCQSQRDEVFSTTRCPSPGALAVSHRLSCDASRRASRVPLQAESHLQSNSRRGARGAASSGGRGHIRSGDHSCGRENAILYR
jgi:hypothetical protein